MKMTKFRWAICAMLFVATTVNYLDRQVLSLTFPDFIKPEFHWTDADYGTITASFSLIYAVACLFAGKFIDWMGTKKGYLWAIFVWSLGACLHAACGLATCWFVKDVSSVEALRAVQAGSATAAAIAGVSVWLFLACRAVLALGEAGNFPAAIKVTAEYFPKKDRAFATSIFNSGASVGARGPAHDSAAREALRLGDGVHHHRRRRLRLDVLLAVALHEAGEVQVRERRRAGVHLAG